MSKDFNNLLQLGLVTFDADGSYRAVQTFEEHQQLVQQKAKDAQDAAQIQQQMQQQPQFGVSAERGRASQQLEPHSPTQMSRVSGAEGDNMSQLADDVIVSKNPPY